MAGPLEGIRILDVTWALAGPFATMILSDLGAEVIKIERRETGDRTRTLLPKIDGVSTYFSSINRGKKSVALDLQAQAGKDIFLELVKQVDVVVENFTPGTMDGLGLGYETLLRHNRRLIYAACSGFGQSGPYAHKPAVDIIVQGMSGIMSITGEEEGPPVRVGPSIADITASLYLVIGILAALKERENSNQGQMIDISMLDCLVAILENAFVRYFSTGEIPQRLGSSHPVLEPFGAYPTQDGYIVVAVMGPVEQWAAFLEKIGRLDLLSDERFLDPDSRYKYRDELKPSLSEALITKSTRQWVEEFESLGIPCGPLNDIAEAADDPQLSLREMFAELPCLETRKSRLKMPSSPIKLSRTPVKLNKGAPQLGADTVEVLSTLLGMKQDEINNLEEKKVIGTSNTGL